VHRTGRTGRAGASGEAISLIEPLEKLRLNAVVRQYGVDMQRRELPTDTDVEAVVAERVTALLEARLRDQDKLVRERMQRMLPLARGLGENDDELAIIAMLLDEYYQKMLHAPPVPAPSRRAPEVREVPAETAAPPAGGRRRRRRR